MYMYMYMYVHVCIFGITKIKEVNSGIGEHMLSVVYVMGIKSCDVHMISHLSSQQTHGFPRLSEGAKILELNQSFKLLC